jgi:hypothetical protein
VIDAYLTALGSALRGPRRAKADLLAEARDHLMDATAAYEEAGLEHAAAQHKAVADFGKVDELVSAYQAELGLAQGHRTALAAFTLSAAQPLVWDYAFPGPQDEPQLANEIVENVGGIIILLMFLAVLAYQFGTRRPPIREKLARLTGIGALTACATLATASTLLTALSGSLLALIWTVSFVLIPGTLVTVSARRCLLSSRPQHTVD